MSNEVFFILWSLFIIAIAMIGGLYFTIRDYRMARCHDEA